MEMLSGPSVIAIASAVALVAFLAGRASAKGGLSGDDRVEARMRAEAAAENAYSALSPSRQAEVDALLGANKLIEAIKLIREETGADLKTAKAAAEFRKRHLAP